MEKVRELTSLTEDFKKLGLLSEEDDTENLDNYEDEEDFTGDPQDLEEFKIFKKRRGSLAKKISRKAKLYYKRNKSHIKSIGRKYRRSSFAKRLASRRAKIMKRFGYVKISKIHKSGKRIRTAPIAVKHEAFEALDKMEQILALLEEKVQPIMESEDENVQEYVGSILEGTDEFQDMIEEMGSVIEEQEVDSEDLEDALYEMADELYSLLDVYGELMSLEEDEEEEE